jgi:GDP/UDP-N,N'-diacetylbacillosamine 2-epimerase (hydrolysing)
MRKICVYTSGRMDYGLLRGVMKEIQASNNLELQIIASGMHLSSEFGKTVDEMIEDGFHPHEKVEILLSSDTPVGICKAMGLAMIGYGEAIQRLQPDIIVLLGDRFETFCMAAAAQVCRVPIAHIHGGETTQGAIDEAFRHSITKMAHLHFASCEPYRQRIIQLGESPERVFNVGALGVENIKKMSIMSRQELFESIGFNLDEPYFVVTFHPVTLEKGASGIQFKNLLHVLEQFSDRKVIFTKTNADTDGRVINEMIDRFAERHSERCMAIESLGMKRYLSAVKYAQAVIGNSSSGILEVPAFKVPTVNIGDRQKGRIHAESVIDCIPESQAIKAAILKSFDPLFRSSLQSLQNPYEKEGTAAEIRNVLEMTDFENILKKSFYVFNEINPY